MLEISKGAERNVLVWVSAVRQGTAKQGSGTAGRKRDIPGSCMVFHLCNLSGAVVGQALLCHMWSGVTKRFKVGEAERFQGLSVCRYILKKAWHTKIKVLQRLFFYT